MSRARTLATVLGSDGSLDSTEITTALGYTPVNKAGDSGLNGWYTQDVQDIYASSGGSSQEQYIGDRAPIQMDKRGWVFVGNVSLDNPGSGGTQYIHLLTNYQSTSAMMLFHLEGYAYNYGNVDVKHGLYMYTGSSILNKYTTNNGNGVTFYNSYKNSAGYLCLVINLGSTGYTSAKARLWVNSHGDNFSGLRITNIARTNSTTYY